MSLASELRLALSKLVLPIELYDTWAEWYGAAKDLAPRSLWVHHNPDGSEKYTPETTPAHYEDAYWQGDTVGLRAGMRAMIMTRTAPDAVWYRLRIGSKPVSSVVRQVLWDLGIRRLTMTVRDPKLAQAILSRERYCNNSVDYAGQDLVITLTKRPELEFYKYDTPQE